jgi:D-lactate dehydrogenase (cytochrome)
MRVEPILEGSDRVEREAPDLLRDESNLQIPSGAPGVDRVYAPASSAEAEAVVALAAATSTPLTLSGARTGISGGAVPMVGGWLLSTARLQGFEVRRDKGYGGSPYVIVGSGLSLSQLKHNLDICEPDSDGVRWHYPVDPTEWSASVGGTLATNASGGRSYFYGPTARWVRALEVVFADGTRTWIRRGEVQAAAGGVLRWPKGPADGVSLPNLRPPEVKCVAGYDAGADGDLVDLLVGSEGTLALIVGAELQLAPVPPHVLSMVCFLPDGVDGLDVVTAIRIDPDLEPMTMEYLDSASLNLLREERVQGGEGRIPELPSDAGSALFLEFPFASEEAMDEGVLALEAHLAAAGASLEATWAGQEAADQRRMRALRHAVPEAVNARISRLRATCPGIHKVGTDLAVPHRSARAMADAYARVREASGVSSVLFGHAAENHLHLNFLPRTLDELEEAKARHFELARVAVSLGGSVTAEHGIGRLKRALVSIQFGEEGVAEMRRIKRAMDPAGILNPGVLLP